MNIKFKSIDIDKFRSIEHANVSLDKQGIVIVKGINEYEDKATSNGSGKSSIFEAIIFAIYEETSSGEKDVANRVLQDGYVVTLKFSIDGDNYTIMRKGTSANKTQVVFYKNDVDISARNKTDTNKLILSTFGITKAVFLDSIFLSQNANTNLASLSPTARKERLEILTNTDSTIQLFKDKLKQIQVQYESCCVDDQMNMNKLQGSKETNLSQLDDIEIKINKVKQQIDELKQLGDINEIDHQIKDKENQLKSIEKEINDTNNALDKIEIEIKHVRDDGEKDNLEKTKLEQDRQNKLNELNEVDNNINKCDMNKSYAENNIKNIKKEIEKIKTSDRCPTCGRKYDNFNDEHLLNTIKEKELLIDNENENINNILKERNELSIKETDIITEGKNIAKQLQECVDKVNEHRSKVEQVENKRYDVDAQRNKYYKLQTEIQNEIKQLNVNKEQILKAPIANLEEFNKMKLDITSKIVTIDVQIENITNKYNEDNDKVLVVKNAIQLVTKEFRTYLLQNSIQYLNQLLLNYSKQLFSNEKDIIHIDEDGIKLNITLGDSTYESLSGGEKTRVNIALLLAQKSLANMIGNMSCNIIILDEILGYCDSHAEEVVIELLTKELDTLESIFMISHKEIPIGYDMQMTVIKNNKGLSRVSVL